MEEILVKRIGGGIRAINGGRKTPQEAGIGALLNRLKEVNLPMYEELMEKYKEAVSNSKSEY